MDSVYGKAESHIRGGLQTFYPTMSRRLESSLLAMIPQLMVLNPAI
jgi:CII-binding regulator of phage lambda lysogenization HflD